MLLRGQNLLGPPPTMPMSSRNSSSAAHCQLGVDVFRIFDAMNDPRNFLRGSWAIRGHDCQWQKHAQGTISYTVSPVHTIDMWVKDLAKRLEDMGSHSIAIKDMAGIAQALGRALNW
jgi:oxaloacetate decarboxylase alpha subunit